jgi:hypothetical protein
MSIPALVATCWTSAGNVAPLDDPEISPFSAVDRIHAVASTGWAGIGFGQDDLRVIRDRVGFPAIRAEIEAPACDTSKSNSLPAGGATTWHGAEPGSCC